MSYEDRLGEARSEGWSEGYDAGSAAALGVRLSERDRKAEQEIDSLETQLATIKRNYDSTLVRFREALDRWQTDAEGMAELLEETEAKLRKEARHSADIQAELDAADLLIEARDAQLEAMRVDRDQALRRGDRWQADAERWLAERDQALAQARRERKDNELLRGVNSEWLAHSHADTDTIKMYVTSNYELIERVEWLEDQNLNITTALERANDRLRGVQQAMSAFVPF